MQLRRPKKPQHSQLLRGQRLTSRDLSRLVGQVTKVNENEILLSYLSLSVFRIFNFNVLIDMQSGLRKSCLFTVKSFWTVRTVGWICFLKIIT